MRRHPLPPLEQPIADTRYLTIEEAAQYLRRTPKAIRRLVERRKIPHLKTGRWITFDRETLDHWMKEQERVTPEEALKVPKLPAWAWEGRERVPSRPSSEDLQRIVKASAARCRAELQAKRQRGDDHR